MLDSTAYWALKPIERTVLSVIEMALIALAVGMVQACSA
jgi:hypothetical protein